MHTYDYHFDEIRMSDYYLRLVNSRFEALMPSDTHGVDVRSNFLLLYVSKGKGTLSINNTIFTIHEHQSFLIAPHVFYEHKADDNDPWTLYWVEFALINSDTLLREINYRPDYPIFDNISGLEDKIVSIYNEMKKVNCNYLLLDSYLYLILASLADNGKELDNTLMPSDNLQKAINYINKHIHENIKVQTVAKEGCAIDTSQLYRIFTQKLGISPHRYIQECKIKKACELIRLTDMSFHDIANFIGCEYDSQFYGLFRKITGTTPSDYRLTTQCSQYEK